MFRHIDRYDRLQPGGLSGAAIAAVVQRAVKRWGEAEGWSKADIAAAVEHIGAHSLRSGFCTSAAEAGATEWQVMQVTGHKRPDTVRRYARPTSLFASPVHRKLEM